MLAQATALLVLAAFCAALAIGLGGRRRRRRVALGPPGLRHLAAQVGSLSDFRLPLVDPPRRGAARRTASLLGAR